MRRGRRVKRHSMTYLFLNFDCKGGRGKEKKVGKRFHTYLNLSFDCEEGTGKGGRGTWVGEAFSHLPVTSFSVLSGCNELLLGGEALKGKAEPLEIAS